MKAKAEQSQETGVVRTIRRIAALLGFLQKGEVDAIFNQQPYATVDGSDPLALWQKFTTQRIGLAPLVVHDVAPLPSSLADEVAHIKERSTYKKHYEAVADYSFMMAPIAALLAPQWNVDIDYIDELMSQLRKKMPPADLLRFAISEGKITEPIVSGSQVLFTSPRLDLHADPIPTVRETKEGEFEIVVRASRRPNYIQVARIGDRLFLVNGAHKVCALWKMGHTHTPCVFRTVQTFDEIGMPRSSSLLTPSIFESARPALVTDFLNPTCAVPLTIRSMYQVLQVSVGVGTMRVPALPPQQSHSPMPTMGKPVQQKK